MRSLRSRLSYVLLLLIVLAIAGGSRVGLTQDATPEGTVDSTATFSVGGEVVTPLTLTVADLQALGLASETVDVTFQSGGEDEDHSFTGVLLIDLLNHAGVPAGPDERNPLLKYYVVVTASDGYQVVFSGGELDPNFGAAPIMVAWEQDSAPITGDDGPVRIAAPGDLRGGRYVFGVVSIDLILAAASPAATPAA